MGIKFTATYTGTVGGTPDIIMSIYKIAAPYRLKLLRFWLMCVDNTYPPGEMIGCRLLRYSGVSAPSSGGNDLDGTQAVSMAQDNSLGLQPYSHIRANDNSGASFAGYEVIWAGGCQVWQGFDIILSGEPSLIGYTGYGPGLDAFALELFSGAGTPVDCNFGFTFEEEY